MILDYPLKIENLHPGNIVCFIPREQLAYIESTNPLRILTHKPSGFQCDIEDIMGYKLTPAILGQSGYKVKDVFSFYKEIDNKCLTINLSKEPFILVMNEIKYEVNYLHHLQNLQLELTGKNSRPNLL